MAREQIVFEGFIHQYRHVYHVMLGAAERIAQEYHLSFEQYLILRYLNDHPNTNSTALAAYAGTSRAAVAHKLGDLIRHGLVDQQAEDEDRRIKLLHLTALGQETEARLSAAYLDSTHIFNEMTDGPTPKEIQAFFETFQQRIDQWLAADPQLAAPTQSSTSVN